MRIWLLFILVYLTFSRIQEKLKNEIYFKKLACYSCCNNQLTKDAETIKLIVDSSSHQPDQVFKKLFSLMMSQCYHKIGETTLTNFRKSLEANNLKTFNYPEDLTVIDYMIFNTSNINLELNYNEKEMFLFMNELNEDFKDLHDEVEKENKEDKEKNEYEQTTSFESDL